MGQASGLAAELLAGRAFGQTFTFQYHGLYRVDLYTATNARETTRPGPSVNTPGRPTVTIIFETGAGPAGDYRYDWAGWGAPRLVVP